MTAQKSRPRIYLAGPEVFLPNAREAGAAKARLCEAAGLEGVFPLDQALDLEGLDPAGKARRIYDADVAMMRSCAAAIANLTPFRGVSMDSGTAFEVGFMRALGRPVFGYTNVRADLAHRSRVFRSRGIPAGDADRSDVEIENFGLSENLMIEMAIRESGGDVAVNDVAPGQEMIDLRGFQVCVDALAQLLLDGS